MKKDIKLTNSHKIKIITFVIIGILTILIVRLIITWEKIQGSSANIEGPSLNKEKWTYTQNFNDNVMPKDWGEKDKYYKVINGALTIFHPGKKGYYYEWHNKIFSDFIYEARIVFNKGLKDKDCGIVFRFTDINNFYKFGITPNGWYYVVKIARGQYKELVGWEECKYINKDKIANILRVETQSDMFKFYINGKLIKEITDTTFTEGKIGFYSSYGVDASLDELGVYELPATSVISSDVKSKKWKYFWNFNGTTMPDAWAKETEYVKLLNNMFTIFYDKEKAGEGNYYAWSNLVVDDFICEAKVEFLKGYDDYSFGVAFRLTTDLDNVYRFGISANGSYIFSKLKNGNYKFLKSCLVRDFILRIFLSFIQKTL